MRITSQKRSTLFRNNSTAPLSGSEFQVGNGDRRYIFERRAGKVIGFEVEDWQYSERSFEKVQRGRPIDRNSMNSKATIGARKQKRSTGLQPRRTD